jgi:hypothetical protein
MKICQRCKKDLPLESFSFRNSDLKYIKSYCHGCCSDMVKERYWANPSLPRARASEWFKNNPERAKANRRKTTLRQHGLTQERFDEMIRVQDNRCDCCGVQFSGKPRSLNSPAIHHSHQAGHVICLLCRRCNTAEGLIKTPKRAVQLYKFMTKDALFLGREQDVV